MITEILPSDNPRTFSIAMEVLQKGGMVAFPTDTVYGVGAPAFNGPSVEQIYNVKERPSEKAIPVLLGDPTDLEKVSLAVPKMATILSTRFWPGPLTLIVPKHPALPDAVSATGTVGVRVPDHPVTQKLLRATGPLAVTSANISGQSSPSTAREVLGQLGGRIALIIDGGKTPGGVPSTVVDCTSEEPVILRGGPISFDEIRSALKVGL